MKIQDTQVISSLILRDSIFNEPSQENRCDYFFFAGAALVCLEAAFGAAFAGDLKAGTGFFAATAGFAQSVSQLLQEPAQCAVTTPFRYFDFFSPKAFVNLSTRPQRQLTAYYP